MKIVTVNHSDIGGGAAKAAYRLHSSFLDNNINSIFFVYIKKSNDPSVIAYSKKYSSFKSVIRNTLEMLPLRLYKKRSPIFFSAAWVRSSNIIREINRLKPDIVHLHWICGGMLRIEDLVKINAPIVWTLHDNWVFTGGCHVKWECEKYKQSCGSCPRLGSKKENDLSNRIWKRKKKAFSKIKNLSLIGPSNWILKCSKESSLLKNNYHINIPNPLDIFKFKPVDKNAARELWNLPKNKKLILYGAVDATSDINKGFKEFSEAIQKLSCENVELIVFGGPTRNESDLFGLKTHHIGFLNDEESLITLYSSADCMVVPSLQEAFGQTASEAMACQTPVVAFNHSGLKDIVDHKVNGYLAIPFDTDDLSRGIDWVLNKGTNYKELCVNARNKIVHNFNSDLIVENHIKLYREIINL